MIIKEEELKDLKTYLKSRLTPKNIASSIGFYSLWPLSMISTKSMVGLTNNNRPEITGWKRFLLTNPIIKMFNTCLLVLATNQGVQQITGLTFDTAQDYLSRKNYPAKVIADFEDKNIRIRLRDTWGKIHTAHDIPPFPSLLFNRTRITNDNIATHSGSLLGMALQNKALKPIKSFSKDFLSRFVTLAAEGTTSSAMLSSLTGLPEELVSDTDINAEQLYKAHTLFMLRASDKSRDIGNFPSKSSEAYIYAFQTVADMYNNPEILKVAKYLSALNIEASYNASDASLIIDAHLNGHKMPAKKEAGKAERELTRLFPDDYHQNITTTVEKIELVKSAMDNNADKLSPLAKKRATLFLEAAKFFTPQTIKTAPQAPITSFSAHLPSHNY